MAHEGALEVSKLGSREDPQPAEVPLAALDVVAADLVGRAGVDSAINRLRRAMLREALARTGGNYTKAALLLGVQRQAVQNMVARYDLRQWARTVRR